MKIVDVGCGKETSLGTSPALYQQMHNHWSGPSAANIHTTEKQTKKEGMAGKITFRKGDAYNLPVEDGWADLVYCRTLLMHLTDPLKAVQEMSRVARKGGTVAVFERGRFESSIPDNEKFTKLATKLGGSYIDGVRKMEVKHFDIGNRLPTIFHKAGLREIMAEVQSDTYLTSDPRRLEDVRDELTFYLATFKETRKLDAKAMQAGRASKTEIAQYNRWFENWTKGMLDDNEKLRNDTVFGAGGFVLTVGRKPDGP